MARDGALHKCSGGRVTRVLGGFGEAERGRQGAWGKERADQKPMERSCGVRREDGAWVENSRAPGRH